MLPFHDNGRREFDSFAREHDLAALRYATWILRSDQSALEVVNDALLKFWIAWTKGLIDDFQSCTPYFFAIVRNCANDRMRLQGRWDRNREPFPVDDVMDKRPKYQALFEALDSLDAKERELLELKYLGNFSYEEISRDLNISVSDVTNYLRRARLALRDVMR